MSNTTDTHYSGNSTLAGQSQSANLTSDPTTAHHGTQSANNNMADSNQNTQLALALSILVPLLGIAVVLLFTQFCSSSSSGRHPSVDYDEEKWKQVKALIIAESDLTKDGKIGEGHFGVVHRARLMKDGGERVVVVKSLKPNQSHNELAVEKFLDEAIFTAELQLKHRHILSALSIYWPEKGYPGIVLPYMQRGDLLSLVRDESKRFTCGDLLHFGWQVAEGMKYLSGQRIVHRDLAARNCLCSRKYVVKIADFGLARDVYTSSFYLNNPRAEKAINWMAPEILEGKNYTVESDVWSYGVLLWELLTRGSTPYNGLNAAELLDELQSGFRLPRPHYACDEMIGLMQECWHIDPSERVTFEQVCQRLHSELRGYELRPESRYEYVTSVMAAGVDDEDDMDIDMDSEDNSRDDNRNGGASGTGVSNGCFMNASTENVGYSVMAGRDALPSPANSQSCPNDSPASDQPSCTLVVECEMHPEPRRSRLCSDVPSVSERVSLQGEEAGGVPLTKIPSQKTNCTKTSEILWPRNLNVGGDDSISEV